jgi:hypothetical protein
MGRPIFDYIGKKAATAYERSAQLIFGFKNMNRRKY